MDSLTLRVGSDNPTVPYEEPRDAKKMCSDRGYHRIENDMPFFGLKIVNIDVRLCYDCDSFFHKHEQVYVIVPRNP